MPRLHLQLNDAQRQDLERLTAAGTLSARVFKRARALLLLDQGHTLASVATLLSVSSNSVANWRDRFEEEARASVTALACSEPPTGHAQWTLRLLADKAVELGYCSRISHTHVATILKKTNSSRT